MSGHLPILYGSRESGHAYKVKLALSVLGIAHEHRDVELRVPFAERRSDFRHVSPYGEVSRLGRRQPSPRAVERDLDPLGAADGAARSKRHRSRNTMALLGGQPNRFLGSEFAPRARSRERYSGGSRELAAIASRAGSGAPRSAVGQQRVRLGRGMQRRGPRVLCLSRLAGASESRPLHVAERRALARQNSQPTGLGDSV